MKEAVDLAVRVNKILPEYINIHDSIFKFSIRHAIPLPVIFKPIDYELHFEGLYFLKEELEQVIASISNLPVGENETDTQFMRVLNLYSNALLETIVVLREICGALYAKGQGNLDAYPKKQYDRDLERYKISVLKYSELGELLSAYFKL